MKRETEQVQTNGKKHRYGLNSMQIVFSTWSPGISMRKY